MKKKNLFVIGLRILILLGIAIAMPKPTAGAQTQKEGAMDTVRVRYMVKELDPAIAFYSYRDGPALLGVGALKELGPGHGEIKSMHTAEQARGRGVGRAMLSHLLDVARDRGFRQVSLETGTMEAFAPARALYASAGFIQCAPFADYRPSADNYFMTLELATA